MLRRLTCFLLMRAFTATAPPTSGVASPLASLLAGQSQAIKAGIAGANANTYIIDPSTGNATVVIGPDISQAPVGNNTATPSFASTGLSGAGIASKMTGSWTQIA